MISYYYYDFFFHSFFHENRTAHASNIKHGQTNAYTHTRHMREYHARASSIEHLHMIPKCHNLNRFIYKIQFVCETGQNLVRITWMKIKKNAENGLLFFLSVFQCSNVYSSHRFIHINDAQFMHEPKHTTATERVITVPIKQIFRSICSTTKTEIE